jgi:hypothetical protein
LIALAKRETLVWEDSFSRDDLKILRSTFFHNGKIPEPHRIMKMNGGSIQRKKRDTELPGLTRSSVSAVSSKVPSKHKMIRFRVGLFFAADSDILRLSGLVINGIEFGGIFFRGVVAVTKSK